MEDPETLKVDVNRTWEDEQERVDDIKDMKSLRQRIHEGEFSAGKLIISIDAIQEELENKNISGASFILGELRNHIGTLIGNGRIKIEEE